MRSRLISTFRQFWERATPQIRRPIYIGIVVGLCIAVLVALGLANTGTFLSLPSSFNGVSTSQAVWGLKPSNLLMVLPLGAFLVVLARSFIGLKAFGLFTPMLIALAFLQIGPVMGPVVLISSVMAGMLVTPTLLKLRMTRVGFLGVLISLIVLVLVSLQMILDTKLQVDAFPVIVCGLCVERWWKQWGKDGAKPAALMAFNTFILAVVIQFVMVSDFALALIEASPLLMPAATGIAIAILGRYRGLRLSEIARFAPIWLERRLQGRSLVLPEDVADDAIDERRKGRPDRRRVAPIKEREGPAGPHPARPALAAAGGGVPPLSGMWVINSPADLEEFARRRVPQATSEVIPNREAQFLPRVGASGGGPESWRPPIHNAWIIRKVEDV
ncbi:7TM domain-containing protein [Erythrobacter sanguineus]|uniref:7 transmembrane helices usually fused to an inactive transglutaminase n=1 Tax=Erythrobacter sanguineus TaxID=198312 RepID=A0A1M7SKH4_9SPHN|nr:7TM domain-containing protein [Erythrobacter sanguineus]SHN58980.1 7 transmembrane helices usually fused to an inactive transglutaminase [Erythrobacter sanguineus]